MTAPDSRDSVERVVAEMRIPHEGGWDNDDVDALADRLQALARGPQQAGGEDVVRLVINRLHRIVEGGPLAFDAIAIGEAAEKLAALQAEVARLTRESDGYRQSRNAYEEDVVRLQAALREAGRDAEEGGRDAD